MSVFPSGGDVPPTDPPPANSVPPPGNTAPPTGNFSAPSGNFSPPPIGPAPGSFNEVTSDDKTMALIAYLGGAFVSFIVPLVIYFMKKEQSKFIAFHAMQALIFHIAIAICLIVSWMLAFVMIGFLLLPLVGILSLVYSILAALAANKGEWYEIPVVGKYARQQVGI